MKTKIELEFSLPEEETLYLQYYNGPKYAMALHEFYYSSLRNKLTHQVLSLEEKTVLEMIKKEFLDTLEAYQLEI